MEHRIRHPKQVSVHNLRSSFTRQAQTNHDDRRTGGPPVLGQQAAGSRAPQNRAAPQAPRTDPRLPRISPYEIACKISTLTEHGALPNAPTPTAVRAAVASYCSSSQQGAALGWCWPRACCCTTAAPRRPRGCRRSWGTRLPPVQPGYLAVAGRLTSPTTCSGLSTCSQPPSQRWLSRPAPALPPL
jgi:hypothetical protein